MARGLFWVFPSSSDICACLSYLLRFRNEVELKKKEKRETALLEPLVVMSVTGLYSAG